MSILVTGPIQCTGAVLTGSASISHISVLLLLAGCTVERAWSHFTAVTIWSVVSDSWEENPASIGPRKKEREGGGDGGLRTLKAWY